MQKLARWLLANEAAVDDPPDRTLKAAVNVCEKLRGPLSTLAGVAGYRALISRALALAIAEVPSLGPVQVRDDGSLEKPASVEPQLDKDETQDGDAVLVAKLLGLLVTFIGETLTMRLVRDAWPDATFDGIDSETEKP